MESVKLSKINNCYVLECEHHERDKPRAAGFTWWTVVKDKWATRSPEVASRVIECASPELQSELRNIAETHKRNLEASTASSSDFDPPVPKGKQLRPFQKAGVEHMSRILDAQGGQQHHAPQ